MNRVHSITSACACVEPWAACVIGIIGTSLILLTTLVRRSLMNLYTPPAVPTVTPASPVNPTAPHAGVIVYKLATLLLFKLKIDDPLDAAPVHGFCGIWGALAPGQSRVPVSTLIRPLIFSSPLILPPSPPLHLSVLYSPTILTHSLYRHFLHRRPFGQ